MKLQTGFYPALFFSSYNYLPENAMCFFKNSQIFSSHPIKYSVERFWRVRWLSLISGCDLQFVALAFGVGQHRV